ncbi:FtsX-like permease family protein [uncultured Roseivirga sp.]|uniref:ABC transporter permease n=2 Tax=Roseivirga TaxID=290180 RepID=UPI00258E96A4|nr:FtsX-like permease family protein [uncultured Roseivirga sp.]|tara:strand:- start:366 stop:2735 length:2370 start_codon:yes stop_codon:yes gene_type:complete
MIKNNLILVFRRLRKEKVFSLVNVLGLTVGLTAFLMIGLYIKHEVSFDQFHRDKENIYRVTSKYRDREWRGVIASDYVQFFKDDVVGLNSFSRVSVRNEATLASGGGKELNFKGKLSTDSNFFEFFSFDLIDGVPSSVLSTSGSAVITETLSKKLFGEKSPIGEELLIEKGKEVYTITGLAKDPPSNSTIQFELVTYQEGIFKNNFEQTSGLRNVITYLKLQPDVSLDNVLDKIDAAKNKTPYTIMTKDEVYGLSPITDQRLYADYVVTFFEKNDIRYLQLFGGIAVVVLLLAIINYINLVTAQAAKKAKEIGLRKVIGAGKFQLMIYQFAESIVVVVFSFVLAFAITERLLPQFNSLLNKDVTLQYFGSTFFLWVIVSGGLIGLLSGLYPAIQIMKVKPLAIIKSSSSGSKQNTSFRKVLVLFQFTVTAILICCLSIMIGQMDYLKQKDLGFAPEALISVTLDSDSTQSYFPLQQEFLKIPGVQKASLGGFKPGGYAYISAMDAPNVQGEDANGLGGDAIIGDASFIDVMEMEVYWEEHDKAIEEFKEGQVIINKSMAESIGALDNPEDKRIYGWNDKVGKKVIAIVEDFHMKSLKDVIEPISIYYLNDWRVHNILVKVDMNNLSATLAGLGDRYESFFGRPFEFSFLDDEIAEFYKKEEGQFKLFQLFSTIALIISLLGLVALTIYSLEQRRKEVSIRKVLGASVQRLILMLNKEYSVLVLIAFIIASPIAYYAMQDWLQEFKYRISLSPLTFIGAFLGFLALSWLVTIAQSLRVSRENPADVLRDE